MEYIRRMHREGFAIHLHTIGDAAMRLSLDAIEAARASDGIASQPDTLAHVQFAAPEDIARAGRDPLFIAYTYSWAAAEMNGDLRVIPCLQRVAGNRYDELHVPGTYAEIPDVSGALDANRRRDSGGGLRRASRLP